VRAAWPPSGGGAVLNSKSSRARGCASHCSRVLSNDYGRGATALKARSGRSQRPSGRCRCLGRMVTGASPPNIGTNIGSRRSARTRAGLLEARMASGASALGGGTRFGHARVLCACCQGRLGDRQIGMMRSRRTPPVRCRDGCKATWYLLSIRGLQAWPKPLPDRVGQ
jgi:hypothetical protein